jgi:hypothetical protein
MIYGVIYVVVGITLSLGAVTMIALGVQGIKRFGWNSRRGLWWWNPILAGLYGAYVMYDITGGRLRPLPIYGAIGLASGLAIVGAFLGVRSRWPDPPKRIGALIRNVIVACVVELIVTSRQLAGSVFIGLALLAYLFVLLGIDRAYSKSGREQNHVTSAESL